MSKLDIGIKITQVPIIDFNDPKVIELFENCKKRQKEIEELKKIDRNELLKVINI
jgi:hypothetical protein